MSRTRKVVKIADVEGNAHQWEFFQLSADKGLTLGLEVWELLGGTLGRLMGALPGSVKDLDGMMLGRALAGLATTIIQKGGTSFVGKFLDGNRRDDLMIVPPDKNMPSGDGYVAFNLVFQGNYGELRRALAHSLEHNFSSFFDEWLPGWGGKAVSQARPFQDLFGGVLKNLEKLPIS